MKSTAFLLLLGLTCYLLQSCDVEHVNNSDANQSVISSKSSDIQSLSQTTISNQVNEIFDVQINYDDNTSSLVNISGPSNVLHTAPSGKSIVSITLGYSPRTIPVDGDGYVEITPSQIVYVVYSKTMDAFCILYMN